jgi:hypothetical protein
MSGHDGLRPFARGEIAAERDAFAAPPFRDFKFERRPGIPVPNLDGVDPVPVRAFAARQQKIDGG